MNFFCLGFAQILKSFRFMSIVKFGNLLAIICLNVVVFSTLIFFLFLLWDSNDCILETLRLLIFFPKNHFFSLLFRLDTFYWPIFMFTDSFVPYLFGYWVHPLRFLFWLLYFSVLKVSFGFYTSCFFDETSYLSIGFKSGCSYFLDYFSNLLLLSFSDNSNICVLSVLVSVDCLFPTLIGIFLSLHLGFHSE